MTDEPLYWLLRDAEDQSFCFTFLDGEGILARVVSSSHVDVDDTVIILRAGATTSEPGYQVHLSDIRTVATPGGRVLFERANQSLQRTPSARHTCQSGLGVGRVR